ncbi:MAG TPA: hypothetical protein DIS66_05505 [Candidatus Omnitrophica bacterium]|nr:hypothetical protein [Candidatus Omnitrophota bacterium]
MVISLWDEKSLMDKAVEEAGHYFYFDKEACAIQQQLRDTLCSSALDKKARYSLLTHLSMLAYHELTCLILSLNKLFI